MLAPAHSAGHCLRRSSMSTPVPQFESFFVISAMSLPAWVFKADRRDFVFANFWCTTWNATEQTHLINPTHP